MAIEIERPHLESPEVSGQNGNGHSNGNRRRGLSEVLLPYNGFIATRATFLDRQPLRAVRQELINEGQSDPAIRAGVIREVYRARKEIREGKRIHKSRPAAE